jgi:hypothetical protein
VKTVTKISAVKLGLLVLFLPAAIAARQGGAAPQDERDKSEERWLNLKGPHGPVHFNHKQHVAAAPDPTSAHRADPKASCVGCHHTRDSAGAPQLWKCAECHLEEGHAKNPRDRNFDEVDSEKAFHSKCVSCHQASNKGPIACGDCHKPSE